MGGRRIAFSTLGCRLNQYETDALATELRSSGYVVVPYDAEADVYIVNTCTVTDRSDRKSRNTINRARRRANAPVVVVTGCYAESRREELEGRDRITYVVDNDRKSRIVDLLDAHFRGELLHPSRFPPDRFAYGDGEDGFHTRSRVKIQDGCDNFCSFCIIPFVRGRAQSRPVEDILEQVRAVVDKGSREVVVTGVNMGRYEHEGTLFTGLLERVLELPGDFRVRVSSIEPYIGGDGLVDLLGHQRLCPHLHLCLQSGSDRILQQMNRRYDLRGYLETAEAVKTRYPRYNLTTDVIVGFPGETEEEFERTCGVVRSVGFSHVHTFPYSLRSGTKAARMDGQVDAREKARRSALMRDLSERQKRVYRSGFVGRTEEVLVERCEEGRCSGYGEHYLPVSFPGDASMLGTIIPVRIERIDSGPDPSLRGSLVRQVSSENPSR